MKTKELEEIEYFAVTVECIKVVREGSNKPELHCKLPESIELPDGAIVEEIICLAPMDIEALVDRIRREKLLLAWDNLERSSNGTIVARFPRFVEQ